MRNRPNTRLVRVKAQFPINMHVAIFVTVVAIVVGLAASTSANDRPSDPFGNHTIELNSEAPLVEKWESLRDQVLLDKAHFHSCIVSDSKTDCEAVSTLMKIVEEARQNEGKALLGHLNRSINLLIKAAPGYMTGPLEAITMRNGDCKSYSIAKYAAARVAGISADTLGSWSCMIDATVLTIWSPRFIKTESGSFSTI